MKKTKIYKLSAILLILVLVTACTHSKLMTIGADGLGYASVKGDWVEGKKDDNSAFFTDNMSGATIGFLNFGPADEETTTDIALEAFMDSAMENNSVTREQFKVEKDIKIGEYDAQKASVVADDDKSIAWVFADSENVIHAVVLNVSAEKATRIVVEIEKSFSMSKPAA